MCDLVEYQVARHEQNQEANVKATKPEAFIDWWELEDDRDMDDLCVLFSRIVASDEKELMEQPSSLSQSIELKETGIVNFNISLCGSNVEQPIRISKKVRCNVEDINLVKESVGKKESKQDAMEEAVSDLIESMSRSEIDDSLDENERVV